MKYKIGDKVRYKHQNPSDNVKVGEVGTICGFSETTKRYGVAFETKDIYKHSCDGLCLDNYGWWCDENALEPVASTLAEIKKKKLTCCINVKNIVEAQFLDVFFECRSYLKGYCIKNYTDRVKNNLFDDTLAFQLTDGIIVDCCSANFYRSCGGRYGEVYEFSDLFPVGSTMVCGDRMYQRTESGITNYKLVPKYKEGRGENHFCNGFRGGKKPAYANGGVVGIHDLPTSEWYNPMRIDLPEFVFDAEQAKELAERLNKELAGHFNAFSNNGISAKNGGKNSMKFTFYFNVNEGTRVDKSCNGTIPTITTSVVLDKFGDPDKRKCYSLEGEATCDKADYDMRQGVLEALANAVFDGNFEKAYDKAVKTNAFCERQDRTCHYCGKVLDTIEEKQAHEAWHVERKKARRERYLLRKRAKEIAFEEAAQKMAKEMIKEDK